MVPRMTLWPRIAELPLVVEGLSSERLEPAAAALAGLFVLGQTLDLLQMLGMGLVIAASAIVLGRRPGHDPAEGAAT